MLARKSLNASRQAASIFYFCTSTEAINIRPCVSFVTILLLFMVSVSANGQAVECRKTTEVIAPQKAIHFFQDDKIAGLYTWLQRSEYEDPDNVLSMNNGILHFTGDGNGYLGTEKAYKDYHLTVEYRWGEKTYGDRKVLARSSGVFLHGNCPDGAYEGQYMAGLECQIIEGGTGDFEFLPGKNVDGSEIPQSISVTIETSEQKDYAGQPTWKKDGKRVALADRNGYRVSWFNHDLEWKNVAGYQPENDLASPGKEWTKLDIISDGDHVRYFVNGVLANEAFDVKPSSGKISLQIEGAEMDFRNFELHSIDSSRTILLKD